MCRSYSKVVSWFLSWKVEYEDLRQVNWEIIKLDNKSCLCSLERAINRVVLVSGWVIWAYRKQKAEFGWRWLWVCCLSFLELYSYIWALTVEKLEHLFLLPVSETSICSVPITARFKVRQFWLPYKRSFYTESSQGTFVDSDLYKKRSPNQYFW